jgi:hypothetical protein
LVSLSSSNCFRRKKRFSRFFIVPNFCDKFVWFESSKLPSIGDETVPRKTHTTDRQTDCVERYFFPRFFSFALKGENARACLLQQCWTEEDSLA